MENPRWWHVAISAIAVVLAALLFGAETAVWRKVGAAASVIIFVVGWFTIGSRGLLGNVRLATVFTVVVVVSTGAATGFYPNMALLQTVAYPLVWVLARNLRGALIANVALAASVGVGFLLSTGDPLQSLFTIGLSLGFSLALGMWISRIAHLSDQRQVLVDELRAAQDQIAAMSRDAGVTSERERLAREIHDTIAQDLTGLVLLAQRTRRELDGGNTTAASSHLENLEEGARTALAETRALVAASAPIGLTAGGIGEALERLGERFERETGITVTVDAPALPPLDRDTEVVLLRCAQEGLANVRKHSGASNATVTLSAAGDAVRLTITDDGAGFDAASASAGFGLAGMRERLALVNGSLTVSSSPGAGTVLEAALPIGATS